MRNTLKAELAAALTHLADGLKEGVYTKEYAIAKLDALAAILQADRDTLARRYAPIEYHTYPLHITSLSTTPKE